AGRQRDRSYAAPRVGSVRRLADEVAGRAVVAHPDLVGERAVGALGVAAADLAGVAPDELGVVTAAAAVLGRDTDGIAALRARRRCIVADDGAVLPALDFCRPALDGLLGRVLF